MSTRSSTRRKNRSARVDEAVHATLQHHVLYEVNPDSLVSQPLVEKMDLDFDTRRQLVRMHVTNWMLMARQPSQFDIQSKMAINVYYPSAHPALLDHIVVGFLIHRPEMAKVLLPHLFDRLLNLKKNDLPFPEQPILLAFYTTFAALRRSALLTLNKTYQLESCVAILKVLFEHNDRLIDEKVNFSYWIAGCLVEADDELLHGVLSYLLGCPSTIESINAFAVQKKDAQWCQLVREEQGSAAINQRLGRISKGILRIMLTKCQNVAKEEQHL